MRDCFDPDELVTLSDVLEPDIQTALSHLQDCSSCQTHLRTLVALRQALGGRHAIANPALESVLATLRAERSAERAIRESPRTALAAEAVLAALTGPAVMYTSGVSADLPSAIVFAAVCAAGVLTSRRLARPARTAAVATRHAV